MSKSLKALLTILIICLITTGCSVKTEQPENGVTDAAPKADNSQEKGIIKVIEFDDSQKKIIRGIGGSPDDIFYFEYDGIPIEYNWLEVWIEYYEKGQKTSKLLSINEGAAKDGSIICRFEDIDNKTRITINGSSLLKEKPIMEQSVTTNKKNDSPILCDSDTEFLLAVRVVDGGNSSAIIPDEIFTNQTIGDQELYQNDYVYLVKGRFYSK
ncbi:hypothetical protein [Desulfosporosinus meridiei]|uniref:Lipoprotein n=1 Tax=Desulfosporosinus meridiei (strain ATCC BAA-275 / DSM 13257 / KCTC 12902 / NCIMB 13706 / S10) TaxID=768704 RepID=J7IZ24_DESMD|nr:hypothetical protein [Desulfosporosinus meridiei]AFQ45374.1 hypothetical protein Desmer_3531 [Desulfosporosinus meridiei DSM 13257]